MASDNVSISKDDLKDIIASAVSAAVAASKAPSVIEQREIDKQEQEIRQAQEDRKKIAESVLQDIEQKRTTQLICSHEHRNGDSHCVYIVEKNGPGFILCQKNQCKIRPGIASAGYAGNDIYDTATFNRLFQKLQTLGEIFG